MSTAMAAARSPISVVMTVYNGQRYLLPQVQSVLAQLEPGDELIAVDDASSDESVRLLTQLAAPSLRLLRNASNQGVRASFERGLAAARHEFVFLCDQDDLWLPGKRTEVVQAFARSPRVTAVISDAEVIDAEGRVTATSFMAARGGFEAGLLATLWRSRYLGCAMAVRRSLLQLALPIPAHVPMHDMWLGAMARLSGEVVYLPRPLIQYRRHGENVSPDSRQPWGQMLRWRWALLQSVAGRWLSGRR